MVASSPSLPPDAPARSKRVLVVEDDPDVRDSLVDLLESHGYAVTSCGNGLQAIHCLRGPMRPDLILLDLMMPEMDGWEFRVAQRRDPAMAGIPVVALSADRSPKAAAIDADLYLAKPLDAELLLAGIDRILIELERREMQARLQQTERMVALGTLAAGVAHEINNPLAFVITNLGVLAELVAGLEAHPPTGGPRRRELDEALRRAMAGVDDVLHVVNRLPDDVRHDFRNALTSVVSYLSLVEYELPRVSSGRAAAAGGARRASGSAARAGRGKRSPTIEEIEELVRQARDGAERVRLIVRDLQTFSRGEDDRRGPVALRRVVESAIRVARSTVRSRARLCEELEDTPIVWANEARLGQVVLNLLVNATQAIPEDADPSAHEIRIRTGADASGRALLEVADTGLGIPPEIRERVFDPFFTTKPVGTGLGLSISHGIVQALGGEITIESEVGKGTLFRVLLPTTPRASEPPPTRIATSSQPPKVAGGRGRVLVVDDDELVRNAVRRSLFHEHDVVLVQNGRAALDRLAAGDRFDVILCDLFMPGLDGMALHRAIATTTPGLADRIIFLTGGAFSAEAEDFLKRGKNRVVEKPFEIEQLREAIRDLLP